MGSRLKEDEKNERIIRGLAKLPANRRCINCNSQGTQYICTNFATFICIHCSGIHREFTHRVKSISMAKFTSQEITALQEGGNERAKRIYFKEWDFQRYTLPDNSDVDKLRDFIKHVYVNRRFMGEKNADKPPIVKSDKEEESWIQERSRGVPSVSEPSPAKNDDRISHKDGLPVREALQVVAPPARLPDPPKLNKPGTPKPTHAPDNNKKDLSTQNAPEVKPSASISLIDFDFDSDREPVSKQQTATPANQNKDVGWASFDTQKAPPVVTPASLESSLVHRPSPGPGPATNYSTIPVSNSNPQINRPAVAGSINQIWGQIQPDAPNMRATGIVSNQSQSNQGPPHFMNGPGPLPLVGTPHQTPASSSLPNTRNALPEDLFSMVYAPMPGWQGAPRAMMGYAMQYPTPPPNHAYYHPIRSSNPFDVVTEPKLAHANTFPSMTSLQGALPNLSSSNPNPNVLSRASSVVSFGSQWAPQPIHPSPYQAQMHAVNMHQQIPSNMVYNGNQVMGGYGTIRNPNSYSQVGGNPFS